MSSQTRQHQLQTFCCLVSSLRGLWRTFHVVLTQRAYTNDKFVVARYGGLLDW